MRAYIVALFVVLTCIGLSAAARAADTPSPSPTASAAAATSALPIFGYFAPKPSDNLPLPTALAGDVIAQVGETLHVKVASLSGGELPTPSRKNRAQSSVSPDMSSRTRTFSFTGDASTPRRR
jgi:hypothetical protein